MIGLSAENYVEQVECFFGVVSCKLLAGSLCDPVNSGQLDQIGVHRPGPDVVEFGSGLQVEPAAVVLPDRAHSPRHLAVALSQL